MVDLWIPLVGGAAAFAHCLGMCGPFCLSLAHGQSWRIAMGRQTLWHAGRICTYVFLGALAGHVGGWLGDLTRWGWMQDVLAWFAGAVMIFAGLSLLGLLPWKRAGKSRNPNVLSSNPTKNTDTGPDLPPGVAGIRGLSNLFSSGAGSLTLGLLTGFLPCPVVLGFLALSAQTGKAASGMAVMGAMGAGTLWSLLLIGAGGQVLRLRMKRWAPVLGGAMIVLLGAVTVLRGTAIFHRLMGCPQTATTNHAPGSSPCCDGEKTTGH